jgi:hypothetical protein
MVTLDWSLKTHIYIYYVCILYIYIYYTVTSMYTYQLEAQWENHPKTLNIDENGIVHLPPM